MERIRKPPAPREDEPIEPDPELMERVQVGANRCPYCHTEVEIEASDWLACAGCLGRHHTACWQESGRCGACGHQERLARRGAPLGRILRGVVASALILSSLLVLSLLYLGSAASQRGVLRAPQPGVVLAGEVTLGVSVANPIGETGAKVLKVFVGSPAYEAGLREGDLIQSVDGRPVDGVAQLEARLKAHSAGEKASLGIKRSFGSSQVVEVGVVERPRLPPSGAEPSAVTEATLQRLGARVSTQRGGGVRVGEVLVGTAASDAGLGLNDSIETVDGVPVRSVEELQGLLAPTGRKRLGVRPYFGGGKIVEIELPN